VLLIIGLLLQHNASVQKSAGSKKSIAGFKQADIVGDVVGKEVVGCVDGKDVVGS
jgi:hypothetical protein